MNRRIPSPGRRLGLMTLAAAALLFAGCESENVIIVTNASSTQLRVFVRTPGGGVSIVTPTRGSSSSVVVGDEGTFYAGAVLDGEWLERMRLTRELVSQQLANPAARRRLSVDQLKELSDRINDLAREIQRATERQSESVRGCSGTVRRDSGGIIDFAPVIGDATAATITITDNPAGGFPAFVLVCSS